MAKRLRTAAADTTVVQKPSDGVPPTSTVGVVQSSSISSTLPSTPTSISSAAPSSTVTQTDSVTSTLPSTLVSVSPSSSSSHKNGSISTSPSSPIVGGGDQISVGEVVGASIGTFFAGILLTLIAVLFFFMHRKKKSRTGGAATKRRSSRGSGAYQENDPSSKEMGTIVRQREVGTDVKLERILLEPVSSQDIKMQIMMINNEILQHVDNNYHLKAIDIAPAGIANLLVKAGYESSTGLAVDQIGLLLQDVKYRRAALRHLIGWFILSNIALTTSPNTSLLPGYVTAVLQRMPPPEKVTGSKEGMQAST